MSADGMKRPEEMDRLIRNALDILAQAISAIKNSPKHSIINFYAAVELVLKSRLLHDHWSLVVNKDPDRGKFEAGDFVSVGFDEACLRLKRVVRSPISDRAYKNFDSIRRHRNRAVHFYHAADDGSANGLGEIASEQLRAWFDLHLLMTMQWSSIFHRYANEIVSIEKQLKGHRGYLQAKYDDCADAIQRDRKTGSVFSACGSCEFESARVSTVLGDLKTSACLVCGQNDSWLDHACPACSVVSRLPEGGEFDCKSCGCKHSEHELVDGLNEFYATKDNYMDATTPANCSDCDGYHTVVEYGGKYLCVRCFAIAAELAACS